jgi:uncharacterized membrane protein YbhN (UPF0104 family)
VLITSLFRLTVFGLVIWGIWRSIARARGEIAERGFSLAEINPGWVLMAAAIYGVGLLPMWWFWRRTLHAFGQKPTIISSMRAYFIGHLGKYVPGKAMVVVLRTSFIRGAEVDTTVAALSVFVETLTMMAVGAFLAAAILFVQFSDQMLLQALALLLMLATGVPLLPPLFRHLVRRLQVARVNPDVDRLLQGLTYKLMGLGIVACTVGWGLLGLSLWATLQAMPLLTPLESLWHEAPRLTASVSLATVAGFLSLLPGGLGVREWVLNELLAPTFGTALALTAAVVLRLVWLATEAGLSAALYLWHPRRDA